MNDLKQKVALVTGAAQGLGREIALMLAKHKADVICADINVEMAKLTADSLKEYGIKSQAYELDLGREESIKNLIDKIHRTFGRIDILINNAGVDITKPILDLNAKEISRVLDINLKGTFLMSRFVFEGMAEVRSGHIINIASTAAYRAWPNATAYHASKWGIVGFSRSLYLEARNYNCRVSVIIPGGMKTPFILERFPDTPLDKLQDPANVASAVYFVLTVPQESIVTELMILPLQETSWP